MAKNTLTEEMERVMGIDPAGAGDYFTAVAKKVFLSVEKSLVSLFLSRLHNADELDKQGVRQQIHLISRGTRAQGRSGRNARKTTGRGIYG